MKTAAACAIALALLGCGGNYGHNDARDRATTTTCDWYEECGEIGSGKRYANRDDCEVEIRAGWNSYWPYEECDGRIPPEALDTCLTAIEITSCGNGLDFLNTLVNKCGKSVVCSG